MGVTPDLILHRSEAGWTVEVKGVDPNDLMLNREYRKRYKELNSMERPPKDERRHVNHYVQRAEDFIGCIQQRRRTMRRIGEYLIAHQPSFVDTGSYEFLRPLTRTKMAEDLGLHESTVSRATMDKFVQLSSGEIVPFDVFFKPALRIQKMIEEILLHENPDNPLSDEAIARILEEKGVQVARRTVNKYRDRTKLLSSRKRRSA
jgi:RNA polymerase sigma-54 factor